MANPAITNYRSLLRDVASGLSKKDVEEMAYTLGFDAAADITSGTHLLREMERQDKLDEDNLDDLKRLLEDHKRNRLAKKVQEFQAAQKSEEPLSKTWPTSTFNQQKAPAADKPRTQSITTEPAMNAQAVPPFPAGMQHYYPTPQGVASLSYQSPMSMQQQVSVDQYAVYPQPLLQSHPGEGHPMQDRNPTHQPVQMANHYYQASQTGNPYQQGLSTPGYAPCVNGGSVQQMPNDQDLQNTIQQLQEKLRLQTLLQNSGNQAPTAVQYTGTPGSQPNIGTPQAEPRSRIQSYPQASGVPQVQGYMPNNAPPGHAKVSAIKSAPCAMSAAGQNLQNFSPNVTEPEASLKGPHQSHPKIENQTWNIPVENVAGEGMPKVNGQQMEKGNVMTGTSSIGGQSPSSEIKRYNAANTAATDGTYQTGRVRADSVENNRNSTTIAAHPISTNSIGNAERQLLSEYGTGKQLYDHRRIDLFENGPYQVKIQEGVHVLTTEGGHVILRYGTNYTIKLFNNDQRLRCSAVVCYNGRFAGDWTVDPRGSIVIERPATEERKFCFIDPCSAAAGSGVTDGDPNNGLVRVVFTPEKSKTGPWNDISRGFGNFGSEPEVDYFGTDDAVPSVNDVPRSLVGPSHSDWQPGATILQGTSSQQFTASEHFQLDESRKKVIEFKLVGRR
ncbi:uncharacterized protein LOC119725949 isoform X2 [Patiria miniata]|uniref:DED domain-containing protein n=1 Tax=Patiria miniata TaxID=46514 RepID=A0A913ZQT6_PATMI|nr:uncharacterized protein LOC119725949 isoform X2 [Patiria miniata]